MSVPNFISLAGLEVAEKFVVVVGWWGGVGWGGEHVTTMSNSNASSFRVELRWVLTIFKLGLCFHSGECEYFSQFYLQLGSTILN